jgi:anti-sigma-K factor RskA
MTEREQLMEQVAALALGVLPREEARKVAYQMALDEELFAEYTALRTAADLVGYEAETDADAVDELARRRMKNRVMKAVRADVATPQQRQFLRAGNVWPAYALTAVACAAAIFAFASNATLRGDLGNERSRNAQLADKMAAQTSTAQIQNAQLADLFAPDSKHYTVKGGEVVVRDGRVYIAMRALPHLPAGKVFQAWTLAKGAKAVAPSVTFAPNPSGSAIVELPVNAGSLAAVALSVEPKGGSKAPTSTPTFVRPLT